MAPIVEKQTTVVGPTLSRRQFVKAAAFSSVGFTLVGPKVLKAESGRPSAMMNSLDPTLSSSWIEIQPDNTILIRTGKSDFGQGSTFTAYRQIVADELGVSFEAITTVIAGDTDRTPDGSGAFDFLGRGTPNIRKAAAYTYQALLDLASERLGVPKDKLSVTDGVISGGGKSISYGDLVKDQQLKLTIPVKGDLTSIFGLTVEGDPPMKPVSEYTVIGKSFKNSIITSKVTGQGDLGDRCSTAGHVARAGGAPEDARLDAGFCRSIGQDQVSEFASHREGQSGWSGCADGVGSDPGRRQRSPGPRNGPSGKACPATRISTSTFEKKRIGPPRRLQKSERSERRCRASARVRPQEALRDIRVVLHEARADRTDDGGRRRQSRMARCTSTRTIRIRRRFAERSRRCSAARSISVIVHSYPGPGHYGRSNGGNAGAEDEAVRFCRKRSANRCGCSGCVPMTCSGRRNRPQRSPMFRLQSTKRARSRRIRSTTTCLPCRTTDRSVRFSRDCRPCRRPTFKSDGVTSIVNGLEDPWIYAPRSQRDGTRTRNIPGRTESVATRRRSTRPQHAYAGAVSAELSARGGNQRSRSARRCGRDPVPHRPRNRRTRSSVC